MIDFKQLADPFPAKDVEWRIGQSGITGKGVWAKVLAYLTNRAIMQRLDEVVGPSNWKNEYIRGPEGGVLCGISIRCDNEWVTKWDGAENTQIEAVKGGLSDAMKRCAVQWGIGRYLYNLEEGWAQIADDSDRDAYRGEASDKQSGKKTYFRWYPPQLPDWALPKAQTPTKPAPSTNGKHPTEPSKEFVDFTPWMTSMVPSVFKTKQELWAEVLLNAGPSWNNETLKTCTDAALFTRIKTVIASKVTANAR